jgi:hypothetical protein
MQRDTLPLLNKGSKEYQCRYPGRFLYHESFVPMLGPVSQRCDGYRTATPDNAATTSLVGSLYNALRLVHIETTQEQHATNGTKHVFYNIQKYLGKGYAA